MFIMLHYLLTFMQAESLVSLHALQLHMAWEAALMSLKGMAFHHTCTCCWTCLWANSSSACHSFPPSLCHLSLWLFFIYLDKWSDMYRKDSWTIPSWLAINATGLNLKNQNACYFLYMTYLPLIPLSHGCLYICKMILVMPLLCCLPFPYFMEVKLV